MANSGELANQGLAGNTGMHVLDGNTKIAGMIKREGKQNCGGIVGDRSALSSRN